MDPRVADSQHPDLGIGLACEERSRRGESVIAESKSTRFDVDGNDLALVRRFEDRT